MRTGSFLTGLRLFSCFVLASVLAGAVSSARGQGLVISEFMAENASSLRDEDGDSSDWVELYNAGSEVVNLSGWALTDDARERFKWRFPALDVPPGGFVVVFASDKNRRDPARPLHANFKLSGEGEYLGLIAPSGSAASSFWPEYPAQLVDRSFGRPMATRVQTVIAEGATARYLVPSDDSIESVWTALDFDDGGWAEGPTGIGFDSKSTPTFLELIQTDVGPLMEDVNASLYVRMPFAAGPELVGQPLRLRAKFEDGIVVHLNGVEVARDNAPATPRYNSRSSTTRVERRALEYETILLPDAAGLVQEGPNVLAVQVLNSSQGNNDLLFLPVLEALGLESIDVDAGHYFDQPTPIWLNSEGFPTVSETPAISPPSGGYDASVMVELSAAPGAEIRFTRDGMLPDAADELYTGPFTLTAAATIRARVFTPGALPGPTASAHYAVLHASLSGFSSDVPIVLVSTTEGRTILTNAFTPASVIVVDRGPDGRARPTDVPHLASDGALKIRGSSTEGRPKKAYNLEIQDARGEDVDVELLGMPSESDWILYGAYNFDRAHIRNALIYELSNQVGRYAVRTRFCEVYVNMTAGPVSQAHYVGVYTLMEKIKRGPDRVDIQELLPTHVAEPEISGGYMFKVDRLDPGDRGFTAGGQGSMGWVDPKEPDVTPAQQLWLTRYLNEFVAVAQGPDPSNPATGYPKYIDVDSWVDHHLLNEFTKNPDGLRLSTYIFKDRNRRVEYGPIWDFDRTMGPDDDDRARSPIGWSSSYYYGWWSVLMRDREFFDRYVQRWIQMRGGPFREANVHAVIDAMADELREAAPRDASRWPLSRQGGWEGEVEQLRQWCVERLAWMDTQLVPTPRLSHPGGPVERGFEVALSISGDVELFYTLNGPDPQTESGDLAPEAQLYVAPIGIAQNTRVTVRGRVSESLWTPAVSATYVTDTLPLVVTEIMYNPLSDPDSGFSTSDFEFLELQNVGDEPIELDGLRLAQRLSFDFSEGRIRSLEPGEFVVVVRDEEAMRYRYGDVAAVTGTYSGSLSNTEQDIRLLGALDEPFVAFRYLDDWEPSTDGDGYSLVIRDPRAHPSTWSDGASWRASEEIGGSPGREDGGSGGGLQRPGDFSQEGRIGINDAIGILGYLFLGRRDLPCETAEANSTLLDVDGSGGISLPDAVLLLDYMFRRGRPPALGLDCVPIPGCADACAP